GAGDRDRARVVCGFHSNCVSAGNHWPVVSTVRAYDCYLGHLLRVQRALVKPGAFCAVAPSTKENARPAGMVLRSIQSNLWRGHARLCELVTRRHSKDYAQLCSAWSSCPRCGILCFDVAELLVARGR